MDPDEPLLQESASVASAASGAGGGRRSGSGAPAAVPSAGGLSAAAPARDAHAGAAGEDGDEEEEYDEDDDGAASVGQRAVDEEEEEEDEGASEAAAQTQAEQGAAALAAAAAGAPHSAPPPSADGPPPDEPSLQAIEAAVASLALKKTPSLVSQQPPPPSAAAAADHEPPPPTPPPPQQQQQQPPAADTAPAATDAAATTAAGAAAAPTTAAATTTDTTADAPATVWSAYPKHYFILSSAGKPIYSYHGDEASLSGLTALISALVSVVASTGDAVQHIRCGPTLIVFLARGPLLFVAASSLGEPAPALRRQLELLHGQLLLIVTSGLERIIQRNPAYDVRPLLDGVSGVLGGLVRHLAADAAYLLAGTRPLPVPAADRAALGEVLAEAVRQSGAVYGLLMADDHVVASVRGRGQPPPHADDLLLLAHFVGSNAAYRHGHGEAFSPVCLPHYNPDAFLHAHIHYLDAAAGVYLVLLAGSAEAFHQLSAARRWFEDTAAARGLGPRLRLLRAPESYALSADGWGGGGGGGGAEGGRGAATAGGGAATAGHLNVLSVENLPRPLGGKFGHTALWSYAIRFTTLAQLVTSPPCPLHRTPAGAARLAAAYARLHSLLHSPAAPGRPNKLAWFSDGQAVLVAVRDRDMELYAVCDPLTDKATAAALLDALRRHFLDRGIAADVTLPPGGGAVAAGPA